MLSYFFYLIFLSQNAHAQTPVSSVPSPGLYSGFLQVTQGTRRVPFQMMLTYSEDEVGAEVEEILIAKRSMRASFVLDQEAGPYNFSSVSYFIEDGRMDLIYTRSSDGLASPSRFRLAGSMKNGVFSGRVLTAGQGDIGSFSLSRSGGADVPLLVTPKYSGLFRGTLKMNGSTVIDNVRVLLSPGVGTDPNPSSYDFEFSPRKSGSIDFEGSLSLAFTRVNIDYLKGTIEMNVVGNNGEFSLRGNLSDTVIRGAVSSSRDTGTFEVRRSAQP